MVHKRTNLLKAILYFLARLALDELAEEGDERVVVVVEEEQEEVDNLLDLLYTGTARQTQGLIQLLESLQVRK